MNSKEIRYRNARSLVKEAGGITAFAKTIDKGQPQASSFAGENPHKGIGNKIARQIEDSFGKSEGWLDIPHDNSSGLTSSIQPVLKSYPVVNAQTIDDHLSPAGSQAAVESIASQHPKGARTFVWQATDDGLAPIVPLGCMAFVDPDFSFGNAEKGDTVMALIEKEGRFALRSEVDDMGKTIYKATSGDYRSIAASECNLIGYVVGIPERSWGK